MIVEAETDIDYLIPQLRLHLGDLNPTSYRYMDSWLRTALLSSIKSLSRWWDSKYLLSDDLTDPNLVASGLLEDSVYRNESYRHFEFELPPTIQLKDERPILLMAAILIKSGSMENSSWDLGHWRDDELSYSNIEGGKARRESIARDVQELENILKPPVKRSVGVVRIAFPQE